MGEEPRGWPGAGLRPEDGNAEREESRAACRRNDSFIASLSRSLVLKEKREDRKRRLNVLDVNSMKFIKASFK